MQILNFIMALVECPECKKQVSNTAKVCPACGYKLNTEMVKKRNKVIKRSILFALIMAVVVGLPIYISYEKERQEEARISWERYLEEIGKPQSYLEVHYVLNGTDRCWEPIDFVALRIRVTSDELNNVPFKESKTYINWTDYARRKK
ncbi:MAG: zinc ribbon domain-containing protein [Lentimicrobiaceae bacterium]|nr:zinc ribbon domain-containing protein [Lentimicrobiaceae bacterium]